MRSRVCYINIMIILRDNVQYIARRCNLFYKSKKFEQPTAAAVIIACIHVYEYLSTIYIYVLFIKKYDIVCWRNEKKKNVC